MKERRSFPSVRGASPPARSRGWAGRLAGIVLAGAACYACANAGGGGGLGGAGGATPAGPSSGGSGGATGGSPGTTGGATGTGTGGAAAGSGGAGNAGGDSSTGGATVGSGGSDTAPGTGGRGGNGGTDPGGAPGGRGAGGHAGENGGTAGSAAPAECPGAPYDGTRPTPLTLSGSLGAHDPAALVVGGNIYLAATGLVAKTSPDLKTWQSAATPLALPDWARTATGAKDLWAPDLASFGGVYHLYYAASTFGSNKSCIGHATRTALDGGGWTDQGMVVCSNAGGTKDDWNAIDPNIVIDGDTGAPWMVLGSFWSGIKTVKLEMSGRRADNDMYAIANHPDGGIEGAWVFRRCGTYYLFVSWGACCSGAYDYNIRVGRAAAITGPYVDKAGNSMLSGGGTQLVKGDTSWVAPGHNAVITYAGKTYNLYHALKGSSTGAATLRVSELVWDPDGWPVSGGP